MTAIAEHKLSSWNDIHHYAKPLWIYRGQHSKEWPLKTLLERCCEHQGVCLSDRNTVEIGLLREFRRAYHQYASHVPKAESVIEWLSLMQHHGAPTRLLDFTYSIYIAAYFAVEAAHTDCAVWAINGQWAMKEAVVAFEQAGKPDSRTLTEDIQEDHEKTFYPLFFERPFVKSATPLNPFRLNERLRTQKGVFLVPGDATIGFMENLEALSGHSDNAIKVIIPFDMRHEVLERLYDMNISRTSLFPGLDGYAQSLGIYHLAYHPVRWVQR